MIHKRPTGRGALEDCRLNVVEGPPEGSEARPGGWLTFTGAAEARVLYFKCLFLDFLTIAKFP